MKRRVYLHIGTPKSGTTYLQDRLGRNRDRLVHNGLTYVDTRTGDHFEAALDLIQERWAGQLDVARGEWHALMQTVGRTKGDVLISHEILAAATRDQIARAKADLAGEEIHLVLTARDLARQIPAEWQEQVKHRGRRAFRGFMSELRKGPAVNPDLWFWRVQSLPDILTRWGHGLPPNRVHVVTVPQPGAPKDELWRRFATTVGFDPSAEYLPAEESNTSLGVVEANVMRQLNRRLAGQGLRRDAYVELVRELVGRRTFGERPGRIPIVLPQKHWSFVSQLAAEWREWLAASGVDLVGSLDDLQPVPPGADHVWVDPDDPPLAEVADATSAALAAVVLQAGQMREWKMRKLARRFRRL